MGPTRRPTHPPTSADLIKRLTSLGAAVRGMVRKRHDRGNGEPPGVESMTADFDDWASIHRALEGVERPFLIRDTR